MNTLGVSFRCLLLTIKRFRGTMNEGRVDNA
jgi:hypothetical protein